MSLLREALKKAERAKEEAQRPAKRAELSTVPLEIVGEAEAHQEVSALALEPEPGLESQPEASVALEPQQRDPAATASIEEELSEPNPKLPFQVALGALGIAVVAAVGYFWYQLQPAPAFAPSHSARPAAAPVPAMESPAPPAKALLPGLPPTTPPASAPQPEPGPAAAAPMHPIQERQASPTKAVLKPAPPVPESIAQPKESTRAPPVIHPRVQSGYAAYQAGDLASASADYEQALREDATNRDALLGRAAVQFTLGNQHARQGRWDEAQLAYSKARAADAENPDLAFNLAVSLEHLHRPTAALEQYRRALELAATRTAHFALESARQRVLQLSR